MKRLGVILFLFDLIIICGCASVYKIDDQKNDNLSMLIVKYRIPDDIGISEAKIHNQAGNVFVSKYQGKFSNELKDKVCVFSNIPAGKYRLDSFYGVSKTLTGPDGRTVYFYIERSFVEKVDQGFWIDIKPGTVNYMGEVYWYNNIKDVIDHSNISFTQVSLGKLYDVNIISPDEITNDMAGTIHANMYIPGLIFRHDHPEIIGRKKALKIEKEIFSFFRRDKSIPKWYPAIDKRLREIDADLGIAKSDDIAEKPKKEKPVNDTTF